MRGILMKACKLILIPAVLGCILSGCGGGGVGVVAALLGDDGGDDELYFSPASASVTTPSGTPIQNDITVQFTLAHPLSTNTSILAEFYFPATGAWFSATISSNASERLFLMISFLLSNSLVLISSNQSE